MISHWPAIGDGVVLHKKLLVHHVALQRAVLLPLIFFQQEAAEQVIAQLRVPAARPQCAVIGDIGSEFSIVIGQGNHQKLLLLGLRDGCGIRSLGQGSHNNGNITGKKFIFNFFRSFQHIRAGDF